MDVKLDQNRRQVLDLFQHFSAIQVEDTDKSIKATGRNERWIFTALQIQNRACGTTIESFRLNYHHSVSQQTQLRYLSYIHESISTPPIVPIESAKIIRLDVIMSQDMKKVFRPLTYGPELP